MADDDTARIPPYLDAKPPTPATTPTDIPVPPVVAEAGDNPEDTIPPSRRIEAAVELTQPVVAIGGNLLVTAANLLRHRGRTRGQMIDEAGCLCVVGALAVAAGATIDNNDYLRTGAAAYEVAADLLETDHLVRLIRERAPRDLHAISDPSIHDVWQWADRLDDDAVLALLDEAADSYQAVAT